MAGRSPRTLLPLALLGGAVSLGLTYAGSIARAVRAGLVVGLAAVLLIAWLSSRKSDAGPDPGRRRFLAAAGLGGLAWVFGGAAIGRAIRRLTTPDPRPVMEEMAHALGAEYMDLVMRAYHPGRSGDVQLLLAPFNSSNYAPESRSLVPRDPRTSHASVWMYLQRVPLAVYAPGIVGPSDSAARVSLADVAPTIANLIGFDGFLALGREGRPLPGIDRPATPPRVVVTFVVDGGGWNVLQHWNGREGLSSAWPNLKALLSRSAVFRNAIHGSFPAVTASAHATLGTGATPRTHGITGHNIRVGDGVRKAYGTPGRAEPGDILVPTLADLWSQATGNRTWIGELGYQVWHVGMIGFGGRDRSGGELPVGVYWNEHASPQGWAVQNPELYRMPAEVPALDAFEGYLAAYTPPPRRAAQFDPKGRKVDCCSPPVIRYQGDLIESTIASEPVGADEVPDLLFINFKAPDYTGHLYNMRDVMEYESLVAVDRELRRLVDVLESRFSPGEFALIVTADHGQCPLPDDVGGTRVDPIQLTEDLQREFGRGMYGVVQYIAPSEVYVDHRALWDTGVSLEDIAAFLQDYRYRDNLGPYVPKSAIEVDLLDQRQFAAVFATTYLDSLVGKDLSRFGETAYPDAEIGVPQAGLYRRVTS